MQWQTQSNWCFFIIVSRKSSWCHQFFVKILYILYPTFIPSRAPSHKNKFYLWFYAQFWLILCFFYDFSLHFMLFLCFLLNLSTLGWNISKNINEVENTSWFYLINSFHYFMKLYRATIDHHLPTVLFEYEDRSLSIINKSGQFFKKLLILSHYNHSNFHTTFRWGQENLILCTCVYSFILEGYYDSVSLTVKDFLFLFQYLETGYSIQKPFFGSNI